MPRDSRVDTYIAGKASSPSRSSAGCANGFTSPAPRSRKRSNGRCRPSPTRVSRSPTWLRSRRTRAFGFWDRQALATGKEGEAMGQYGRIERLDDLPSAEIFEDAGPRCRGADRCRAEARSRCEGARSPKPRCRPNSRRRCAADPAAARPSPAFRRAVAANIASGSPKRSGPRPRRSASREAVEWMREGKRRNWKYENC